MNDLNDIREWVLSLHFESLTDFVQEMGQWSLMLRSDTLTSVNASGLFVYIYVGEWGWGVEGNRLEAWMKSHKSEVAIT